MNEYFVSYIIRHDLDKFVPCLTKNDFPTLKVEENFFNNNLNIKLKYFIYFESITKNQTILFLPGMGPGHTIYLREIETFCHLGYKVITLDYMGSGESDGDNIHSFNQPTKDVEALLKVINEDNLVIVGHSLGGYTTLNTIHLTPYIKKAVIISGFYSLVEFANFKFKQVDKEIYNYEKKLYPDLLEIDNLNYLNTTNDKILFIHSKDDPLVNYQNTITYLQNKITNPNISYLIVDKKKHNPNHSEDAVNYMINTLVVYQKLVRQGKLTTNQEKYNFMKDVSPFRMSEQDQDIIKKIINFLDE